MRATRRHAPPPLSGAIIAQSPNRILAAVVGAVYLAVGLAGFAVTGSVAFLATDNADLLFGVLQLNAAQNVLHLVIGAAMVGVALTPAATARTANATAGAVLLVLGLVGLFVAGLPANVLALNGAGNALHFGTAVVLLAAGLGAEKSATRAA